MLSVRVEIVTNLELRLRRDVALRAVDTANARVSVGAKQIRSRGDPHRLHAIQFRFFELRRG